MPEAKKNKFTSALASAGKTTLTVAGTAGSMLITALSDAADIKRRDDVREKLSYVSDRDLDIAAELIAARQAKKN